MKNQKTSELLSPHRYIGYTLTPLWGDHNSLGYRGEEFPEKKPEGEKRVVIYGDSIIYQDNGALSIPAVLNEIVPYRVINAGVGGYSSLEILLYYLLRGLDINPDIIIIHPCVDDVRSRLTTLYKGDGRGRRAPNAYQVRLKDWSFKNAFRNLTHIIGIRRHQIVSVASKYYRPNDYSLLDKNSPFYFRRNLEIISSVSDSLNIKVFLCTLAFDSERTHDFLIKGFSEHNEVVRQVCNQKSLQICDLEKIITNSKFFRSDGYHYNDNGVKYVAKVMKEVVEEI